MSSRSFYNPSATQLGEEREEDNGYSGSRQAQKDAQATKEMTTVELVLLVLLIVFVVALVVVVSLYATGVITTSEPATPTTVVDNASADSSTTTTDASAGGSASASTSTTETSSSGGGDASASSSASNEAAPMLATFGVEKLMDRASTVLAQFADGSASNLGDANPETTEANMDDATMRASTPGSVQLVAPNASESEANQTLAMAKRFAGPAVDRAERLKRERMNGKGVSEFGIRQRSMDEMRALELSRRNMSGTLTTMLQEPTPPGALASDNMPGVHSTRHLLSVRQPAVDARGDRVMQGALSGNLKDMVRNMPNGLMPLG